MIPHLYFIHFDIKKAIFLEECRPPLFSPRFGVSRPVIMKSMVIEV